MRARRTKKGIVFIDGTRDVCGVRARDGWFGNDDWRDARVGRGGATGRAFFDDDDDDDDDDVFFFFCARR